MRIEQEYEVVRIDDDHDPLKEHPKNPKRGDEELIGESIDENGWFGAVIAQKSTGYILAGNHRYRVAKKKGAREIPVIWKDVDDETAIKMLLVDNKSAMAGEFDEGLLEELLAGLDTLDGTGYVLASAQEVVEGGANPPTGGGSTEELDLDDVPQDKYVPQWAVIVQCTSERQQEETYRWLKEQMPKRDIRLTAV